MALIVGCSCDAGARDPDAGRPPPSEPETLDARQTVAREWLRAQAISETHFGAPVLYAWLTDAEADAVRGGTSVALAAEPEDERLEDALDGDGSEIAAQLRQASGRRRAWPSAWASRRDGEGTHLARVELRPESVLLVYDARVHPTEVRFSTERGVPAPFGEASQVSAVWAAVLVLRPTSRTYVLLRPEMIGRVSLGSIEIANELRTERERLVQLAADLPEDAVRIAPRDLASAWSALPDEGAALDVLYAAAIASPARDPLGQAETMALVRLLTDRTDPFEWRSSIPSEPRPQFFE